MRQALFAVVVLIACIGGPGKAGEETADPAVSFHFGTVAQGVHVEHRFALHNGGAQPLRIASVELTPPLQLGTMPAQIPAGETGFLKLSLDTSKVKGEFSGQLLVTFSDLAIPPRSFSLGGKITPSIEVLPRPAFFVSTPKGMEKSASIEIVNHDSAPLGLTLAATSAKHYRARLETLEAGRRYRVTITLRANALAGRKTDRLVLHTSNPSQPTVYLGVNTLVRERVYTFPDSVDFGQLKLSELHGHTAAVASEQTLMVYQTGGRDFTAIPRSNMAGLAFTAERGPQGDRVQVTASLDKDVPPGPFTGMITLQTNDPGFPQLQVPVTGEILAE